jgi:hypothetical protein
VGLSFAPVTAEEFLVGGRVDSINDPSNQVLKEGCHTENFVVSASYQYMRRVSCGHIHSKFNALTKHKCGWSITMYVSFQVASNILAGVTV